MSDELIEPIFARRLRAAREFRRMTQAELSGRSGVPLTSIAHLEGGGRKPSFDTFVKLVKALEVRADFLIGNQEDPISRVAESAFLNKMRELTTEEAHAVEQFLDFARDQRSG